MAKEIQFEARLVSISKMSNGSLTILANSNGTPYTIATIERVSDNKRFSARIWQKSLDRMEEGETYLATAQGYKDAQGKMAVDIILGPLSGAPRATIEDFDWSQAKEVEDYVPSNQEAVNAPKGKTSPVAEDTF